MKTTLFIVAVIVLFLIFDEYQASNSGSQSYTSTASSTTQIQNPSVAGSTLGYSFYEIARNGPSTESKCQQFGGFVESSISKNLTIKNQLEQGLLVVYHEKHKRTYLSVGFGEQNFSGSYDLKSCLFNY